MTASPISDLNPLFMAAGVFLTLASKGKQISKEKLYTYVDKVPFEL